MRQSKLTSEQVVTDVMQISRSVARLFFRTEQVKKFAFLYLLRDAKAEEAKAAGADFVGGDELIPKIQNEGWLDFDVVVATPDMMGVVGRLGRVLGPKGLNAEPESRNSYDGRDKSYQRHQSR